MNITDFEEYFSPRILERGKEYYRNHHVITLDRILSYASPHREVAGLSPVDIS